VLTNATEIVVSAGGFILQLMPGADDDTISFIENKISSNTAGFDAFWRKTKVLRIFLRCFFPKKI